MQEPSKGSFPAGYGLYVQTLNFGRTVFSVIPPHCKNCISDSAAGAKQTDTGQPGAPPESQKKRRGPEGPRLTRYRLFCFVSDSRTQISSSSSRLRFL